MNTANAKLVIFFLWLLFGYLGVHRIFAGKRVSGFIMLLLFSFGILLSLSPNINMLGGICLFILGIWYIVDLFLFALKKI